VATTVLYFAWIKERIGTGEEHIEFSNDVSTVADAIGVLKQMSPQHADALHDMTRVRVAVDQTHVSFNASIKNAREIAFFPPVTGG
jgi:sulfur-carrier protein